jgi:hypothetical protein
MKANRIVMAGAAALAACAVLGMVSPAGAGEYRDGCDLDEAGAGYEPGGRPELCRDGV